MVPEVETLSKFYKNEGHQNYYENIKGQPYCQMVILPKIKKIERLFKNQLKKQK
jgi:peptide-methionine (S)-S-oxide reductase